eukprot:GHVL01022297.1.p1 GENE.GHVL01022297.1~~GHVL01022297.1.p1  ORF type:complete len:530 (-),score=111.51 GHVL01022297.1:712-2301(-)
MNIHLVSKSVTIFTGIKVFSKVFADELQNVLRQTDRFEDIDKNDLVKLTRAIGLTGYLAAKNISILEPILYKNLEKFSPNEISHVLWAAARCPAGVTEQFYQKSALLIPKFLIKNNEIIEKNEKNKKNKKNENIRSSRIHGTDIRRSSLVNIIWAFKKRTNVQVVNHYKIYNLSKKLLLTPGVIESLTPVQLGKVMWCYIDEPPGGSVEFFERLILRLKQLYTRMSPSGMTICLLALSRVAISESRPLGVKTSKLDMFISFEEFITKTIQNYSTQNLINVLFAFSSIGVGSNKFYSIINHHIQSADLDTYQLSVVTASLGNVRAGVKFCYDYKEQVLKNLTKFPYHQLAAVAWGYSASRFYDEDTWKKILAAMSPEGVSFDRRLGCLYPALANVSLAVPSLDQERIRRYLGYTHSAFWRQQQSETVFKFTNEIQKILESKNIPFRKTMNFQGFRIDFFIPLFIPTNSTSDKNIEFIPGGPHKGIAILCYGPQHQTENFPLGDAMLRYRYLISQGLKLINIEKTSFDVSF